MPWIYLSAAIACEVFATIMLKVSGETPSWWPLSAIVAGYGAAFLLLSFAFKTIPVGVAYAVWSGAGSALVAIVGYLAFSQPLGAASIAGITMIISGVVLLASVP